MNRVDPLILHLPAGTRVPGTIRRVDDAILLESESDGTYATITRDGLDLSVYWVVVGTPDISADYPVTGTFHEAVRVAAALLGWYGQRVQEAMDIALTVQMYGAAGLDFPI